MQKGIFKRSVLPLIVSVIIVALDQFTKYLATSNFEKMMDKDIIDGIIEFGYLHNSGVAYGLFQGGRWVFVVITGLALIAIVVAIFTKKVSSNPFITWIFAIILGGGLGNLIDRIRFGYVVDFIRFPINWFYYSFNVADVAVVCGGVALVVYLIVGIIKDQASPKDDSLNEKSQNNN